MSQHDSQADVTGPARGSRRGVTGLVLIALVTLGSGLAACGDDDDAGDSSESPSGSASSTTDAPATTEDGTTIPPEITQGDGSTVTSEETTDAIDAPEAGEGTDSASATTTSALASDAALAADASTPGGSAADGSAPTGPTTTGPECEFEENSEYPLVRCNMGPAVAVLQSVLQAAGYDVSTVDGLFGDETLFAVQAFQEAEGLTVDGIVGVETWTALDPQDVGNDDNGNGVTDPNEVELGDET